MDVLVLGGDGFVGRHLVAELVERGHAVTSLSRSPDPDVLPSGVDTVEGNVTDYESIEGAFEGKDAAVFLPALSPLFEPKAGNDLHFAVHRDGTDHAVRAAEAHGVDRYLQMSALGADPEGPTHYIRAKGEAEDIVRASGLDWTIVRPSVIFGAGGEFVGFTKLLTTPYVTGLPGGGTSNFHPIHVGDLVPMLADALAEDAHVGETYEFGGPDVLSLADVARLAYRADGRSVRVLPVPMPLAGLGLTLAHYLPLIPFGPDQYRSLQFDNTTDDNDVSAFGKERGDLTTLRSYLGLAD